MSCWVLKIPNHPMGNRDNEEKVLPSISNQNYKGDLALSCTVVGRGALYIEFRFTRKFLKNQKSGIETAFTACL